MPAPSWAREANTTIHEYIRDEEINILRNRLLTAMLMDRGRISYNHAGDYMDWKVRFKRAPMQGYADMDVLTFPRRNRWQTAQLDWRGYAATDAMSKREKLANRGEQAIVKVLSTIVSALKDDVEDAFGEELYVDGNASGNTKKIHGIESFLSVSGANANQPIGTPNDTYAGISCTLGGVSGSASSGSNWPTGTFTGDYDFWSPLVIDYTSAVSVANGGWSAGTKTWPNTCKEALRFGIIKSHKNKTKRGMLDLILLEGDLFRQFKNALDSGERLVVQRGDGEKGAYALGFTDTINFDGVDVTFEYGIGATLGYGFNMANMEIRSMQAQLFVADEIDYDVSTMSDRFSISFFGNARFNPRYFCKWDNVS